MVGSTLSSLVTGWSTVIKSLGGKHKKKKVKEYRHATEKERKREINITQKLQREREREAGERYLKHAKERDKDTESRRELGFVMSEKVSL